MNTRIPAMEIVDGTIIGVLPQEAYEDYLPQWIDSEVNEKVEQRMKQLCPNYFELIKITELHKIDLIDFAIKIGDYTKVKTLVPIDMSTNGEVYVSNDHLSYNFEDRSKNTKGAMGLGNIYDSKPVDGTIIGKATEKEREVLKEIDIKMGTLERLSNHIQAQVSFADFKEMYKMVEEIERKRVEFWLPIYKRLNAHWEWSLFIDYANGNIYVQNFELPYSKDENEVDDD
ncbi:hypothetical protein ACFW35_02320 [Fictibacillus sp. NPDC058756]|uniref:hypothetical protein n=1 Tax=Fictibacillus sp. NPDC058756 TaxID=3346625 RepID=UPI0036993C78